MAAVEITEARIQTLINGVIRGGGRKSSVFSSGDPVEWKTWRSTFVVIADINGWQAARAKQEVRASMDGNAARTVRDIDFAAPLTVAALLDLYEARFLPAASGRLARAEFINVTQSGDETLLQWHSRCREHFMRAFPDENAEPSQKLRDQFIMGIIDEVISTHVYDANPDTYAGALDSAQRKSATRIIFSKRSGAAGGGLHHMENQKDDKRGCHFCGDLNHFQRDCKLWTKAKGILLDGEGNRRGGGGRGRPGRRGRGFRRGGGRGQRGGGRGGLYHLEGGENGEEGGGGDDGTGAIRNGVDLLTFGKEDPEN
jgi:hypothetical protein